MMEELPKPVADGLAFVDALEDTEQDAFLAFFAGARTTWTIFDNDRAPFIGKAECEWVKDWRGFYAERLPAAGLFCWEELETGDALGMVRKADGSYHKWIRVRCRPTELGFDVRDAWWARWKEQVGASDAGREADAPRQVAGD
jgi:hypothetical protein